MNDRKYFKAIPRNDLRVGSILFGNYEHYPCPPNCEALIEEITKDEYKELLNE